MSAGDDLRQGRLLDREERADLVAARTDHSDRGGQQQEPVGAREDEDNAGRRHQQRAGNEHSPAPVPVRPAAQPERHAGVSQQGQREQPRDRGLRQAEFHEVQHEHDRDQPVAEESTGPGHEEQAAVVHQRHQRPCARIRVACRTLPPTRMEMYHVRPSH